MKAITRWSFIAIALVICLLTSGKGAMAETVSSKEIAKLGGIYYYGYEGLDLEKIKKAIPFKVGDLIDVETWSQNRNTAFKCVETITGKPYTDAALVQVSDEHILFVGLPGKSNTDIVSYLPVGKTRLPAPADMIEAYNNCMNLLPLYLQNTKNTEPLERMKKLDAQLKQQASERKEDLRKCLRESSDTLDRAVAAYALGLAASDAADFEVLTRAARDSSSLVRNNSTRELGVTIHNDPTIADRIPEDAIDVYADMLNSRTWTDRNKGTIMMVYLSKTRNKRVLDRMKAKALPSLIEMCHWPSGYSESALTLIGRITGIPEDKLGELSEHNKVSEVLETLK